MARKLKGGAIQSNTITITQIQTTAVTNIVTQSGPRVSSLIYPGNDTAGNTVGGQTVYINGSGFETNNAIYISGNAVPSKSFISASNLSFTTPALAAGIYPVYVINTDSGATAIFIPGYVSSAEPAWVTSAGSLSVLQNEESAWSYSLSATGDAPITYALASGSSLPTGVSLAANGLISGTITSPSGNTTTYTFSANATDAQNQDSTRQFTVTTTAGEGVLFANNVLLIHADGTNNQNNHTFLDSSNNNFTITRNGNATQGTFSPFSQTGWSGYFDGTGDYLTTPANTAFTFGTTDFTIEGWFYLTTSANAYRTLFYLTHTNGLLLVRFGDTTSYNGLFQVSIITSAAANVYSINKSQSQLYGGWHHFAFTRSGSTCRVFIDGIQENVGSGTNVTSFPNASFSDSTSITSSATLEVGRGGAIDTTFIGYISNLRILKGTALYTANSSPPTAALTNIANTSLLTLQSNRFIDNSNNNFAITRNGDTSIQAFSPFAPTAAYSAANVGGSGYFDGTGDYLTAPDSAASEIGASNFCVEGWFYPTVSSASYQTVFCKNQAGISGGFGPIYITFLSGVLRAYSGSTTAWNVLSNVTIGTPQLNAWNHFVVCRSGANWGLYLNGTRENTSSSTATLLNNTANYGIGAQPDGAETTTGYLSGIRLVIGSSVYDPTQSTLTVPTAPLTAISGTSLLLNYTNAGIFDQTAKTVLETVGDAKVSTAQYKYGTGSIALDGTGDYLKTTPNNAILTFGTGDLTLECWIYQTATSTSTYRVIFGDNIYGSTGGYTLYSYNNALNLWKGSGGGGAEVIAPAGTITLNTWTHVAWTRSGSSNRLFINGTQVGATTTDATNYTSTASYIGASQSGTLPFAGYIDDLRITKGNARYTSNTFTVPTAALKDR